MSQHEELLNKMDACTKSIEKKLDACTKQVCAKLDEVKKVLEASAGNKKRAFDIDLAQYNNGNAYRGTAVEQ